MSKLLSDTIKELHLDPHSPYPWQILHDEKLRKEKLEEVKRSQSRLRLHLVERSEEDGDE